MINMTEIQRGHVRMRAKFRKYGLVPFHGCGLAVNTHTLVNHTASDASSNPAPDVISTKSTKGGRKHKFDTFNVSKTSQ